MALEQQRHFTPHTGSPDFDVGSFPDHPEGTVWQLETDTWTDEGVWWRLVPKNPNAPVVSTVEVRGDRIEFIDDLIPRGSNGRGDKEDHRVGGAVLP